MQKIDSIGSSPSRHRARLSLFHRLSIVAQLGYLVMGALTSGCATTGYALGASNAKSLVLQDATKDLDCPMSDITAEEGWGGRWHVVGCGRKANYNAKCDGIACQVAPDGAAVPWEDRPTNDPMWQH